MSHDKPVSVTAISVVRLIDAEACKMGTSESAAAAAEEEEAATACMANSLKHTKCTISYCARPRHKKAI